MRAAERLADRASWLVERRDVAVAGASPAARERNGWKGEGGTKASWVVTARVELDGEVVDLLDAAVAGCWSPPFATRKAALAAVPGLVAEVVEALVDLARYAPADDTDPLLRALAA